MVPFVKLPEHFIVTHAGIHKDVLPHLDELEFANVDSPLHNIGWARGGRSRAGGIFWCDFNDEFIPIPGVNQIFGHTAYGGRNGIRTMHTEDSLNYCIDCLDHKVEFLKLEL